MIKKVTKNIRESKKKSEKNNIATSNSIGYNGKVEIELMRGSKTYKKITSHNMGTKEFFRILSNSLMGINESSRMPKFIHLYFRDSDNVESSRCHLNIPYSTLDIYEENSSYRVEFRFLIPFSQMNYNADGSGNVNSINLLKLYNSPRFDSNVLSLAEFELGENVIENDNRTNLLITWAMSFSNMEN